jgi:hypothetical protein
MERPTNLPGRRWRPFTTINFEFPTVLPAEISLPARLFTS